MKTYKQRTESILQKTKIKTRQKKAMVAGISTAVIGVAASALALVLFLPYPTAVPSVTQYQNSAYYPLIEKLNEITYVAPRYKNNFEKWTSELKMLLNVVVPSGGTVMSPSNKEPSGGSVSIPSIEWEEDHIETPEDVAGSVGESVEGTLGEYVETTDNQVEGVTEADLLKRTENYAFYLNPNVRRVWNENGYYEGINGYLLRVYSIEEENSKEVESFAIEMDKGVGFRNVPEMYLSADGKSLTVIMGCFKNFYDNSYTLLVSIDISNPTQLVETNRTYFSGRYLSSRLVDGELLLFNSYQVTNPSFEDETTFLPQYGDIDDMQSVAPENVVCSEVATTAKYTVVSKLEEKTLRVLDQKALLSYSEEAYVSKTNIFLTQEYAWQTELKNGNTDSVAMTEISCINYVGEGLELQGTVCVDGTVKNQYSMDEYENVLRVATTYSHTEIKEYTYNGYAWASVVSSETNANLYCIDLTNFETVAKVEKFAPKNETVESVRFNGTKAYVCTAEVVTLTDPVFFFDLSDLQNITWTDTGTIEGYSSSLIDFGHGYLVGIGYNDARHLKIEVYTQGEGVVNSVCAYEEAATFSEDYKSYLIDRKNGLIGLGVFKYTANEDAKGYVLLQFSEGEFVRELFIPMDGATNNFRAFYEEEYLYIFNDEFKVVNIG